MGVQERLSLEAVNEHTLLACEHQHRYAFAAQLCDGLCVIDLACGTGYGSAILSDAADRVLGIDNDVATIESATLATAEQSNVSFEAADAVEFLRGGLNDHDAIVCFEGLEHFPDLAEVLQSLRRHAKNGKKLIVSVPNSRAFDEDNEFHLTDFGYEGALEAFEDFPDVQLLYQFSAEGSLIRSKSSEGLNGELVLDQHGEPEYAKHFIACVNLSRELTRTGASARMQLNVAPVNARYQQNLERANQELWRENARIGRHRIGVADSAAASLLARVDDLTREKEAAEQSGAEERRRLELAVADLERRLLILDTPRHRAVENARERLRKHPLLYRLVRPLWRLMRR
jgi:SAM-dependent methyltransferase